MQQSIYCLLTNIPNWTLSTSYCSTHCHRLWHIQILNTHLMSTKTAEASVENVQNSTLYKLHDYKFFVLHVGIDLEVYQNFKAIKASGVGLTLRCFCCVVFTSYPGAPREQQNGHCLLRDTVGSFSFIIHVVAVGRVGSEGPGSASFQRQSYFYTNPSRHQTPRFVNNTSLSCDSVLLLSRQTIKGPLKYTLLCYECLDLILESKLLRVIN